MFLVAGTTTADLFVFSPDLPSLQADDGFRAGNLLFTDRPLTILLGGNGGNTAYVLAGLGVPVGLVSAVGQDVLGDTLTGWLRARQVDLTALVRSPDHATSSSTIIFSDPSRQVVFHHLGASAVVHLEQIPPDMLAEADGVLIASLPILPRLRGQGCARLLETVHRRGGLTAVDIGPAIGQPATLAELRPLLPHIDILLANEHELGVMAGTGDWETAARLAVEAGAGLVVVKRGGQGVSARGRAVRVDIPAFPVDARLTVGAGDSFDAGFLYARLRGRSLEEALRFGAAVAALVVSGERGVLAAPTPDAVTRFLKVHKMV